MAENENEEQEEQPKSKKKLIIIISVVALLLVVGGVGAFLAFGSGKGKNSEDGDFAGEESYEEEADLGNAILPLDTMVVNLGIKGSFLKVAMQLEFVEAELPPTVENDLPRIQDAILGVLSTKTATELLTPEGKESLREEIVSVVNEALGAEEVSAVFFTEFIIQ